MNIRLIALILVFLFLADISILQFLNVDLSSLTFFANFFISLLPNILTVLIGLLVINALIEINTAKKLRDVNQQKSYYIEFISNRFIFWILEYLSLASIKDGVGDDNMQFRWACDKLGKKSLEIDQIFFNQLILSDDRCAFVEGFIKILKKGAKALIENLEKIYPHPDAEMMILSNKLYESAGRLSAVGMIAKGTVEINEKNKQEKKESLTKEQIDLLLKIAFIGANKNIVSQTTSDILEISKRAHENRLFVKL